MTRTPDHQHWVLLGTGPASEQIWGLRRIEFPCGYHVPAAAFAETSAPLERPAPGREVWGMGGFALEIARGGKNLSVEDASQCIAGFRPWLALFHDALLDELTERQHTIAVWDRGVSIFYGLWREACQALGERMTPQAYAAVRSQVALLAAGGTIEKGSAASDYAHQPAAVISFMSQFMTLSEGDIYVLGPLVARRITPQVTNVSFRAGDCGFEMAIK